MNTIRITFCQLNAAQTELDRDLNRLKNHAITHNSELVLLPELPFYSWFPAKKDFHQSVWEAAVDHHNQRLEQIAQTWQVAVLGTRPVIREQKRINEGFCLDPKSGYSSIHQKFYLPDEERFWEASWYEPGNNKFNPSLINQVKIGFLICTDLWFSEHARNYGMSGTHIIANPRATEYFSVDKWIVGGQAAAIRSGAYCISSNRCGVDENGIHWGGAGWIMDPNGKLLAQTSHIEPFITLEIDLDVANEAKSTYPRYI